MAARDPKHLGYLISILTVVSGVAGLLLAVLHGIEATIWAAVYVWLGALHSPQDALLYSLDSLTTRNRGTEAPTSGA